MVDTLNATRDLNSDLSLTDALDFFKTKIYQSINTIILGTVIDVDLANKRLVVKSLINGVNSKNAPINPPNIYDVPYGAVRGGNAGIITHFVQGDNVIIGFCQRQIDTTKSTSSSSTPTLYRYFSLQDAVVLSHWSNNEPTIFLKITDDEITIQATNKPISITTTGNTTINANNATINATGLAKIQAPSIEIDGSAVVNGTLTIGTTILSSTVPAIIDSHPFLAHIHSGGTLSGGLTGPVT